jgi:hypothetical protein
MPWVGWRLRSGEPSRLAARSLLPRNRPRRAARSLRTPIQRKGIFAHGALSGLMKVIPRSGRRTRHFLEGEADDEDDFVRCPRPERALNQPSATNAELADRFDPASLRNLLPARIASQIQAIVMTKVTGLSQRTPIKMKTADTSIAAPLASR